MEKPIQITGKYLKKIFKDEKFKENIKLINSSFEGFEAAFDVKNKFDSPMYEIMPVILGNDDRMSDYVFTGKINKNIDYRDYYTLISLHSHTSELIAPSTCNLDGNGDLMGLNFRRREVLRNYGADICSIEIILGQTNKNAGKRRIYISRRFK